MLDIHFIRENPEVVKKACKSKNMPADIDTLLRLDGEKREMLAQVEEKKHERNAASKRIGEMKRAGRDPGLLMDDMKKLSDEIKKADLSIAEKESVIQEILIGVPNIPHKSVPVGADASKNAFVHEWGEKKRFSFKPKVHDKLGEELDILDLKRAAKITGSGFVLFKGAGALLERALIDFMIDIHVQEHGFIEISPPFIVNRMSMFGTGQLPKLEEDMYDLEEAKYFLIPTAEVPVTNIFRDEILQEDDLPVRYVAYTPCFRKEAGSYGKDTTGMTRVHQFDKVELVKFVKPEESYQEHEDLLKCSEKILQKLDIPYRVLLLASGDMSFAAAKCYDIEAWSPGLGRYLEVSSCSNFEDFQARRMNIRFRRKKTGKNEFVHTLNSSGIALARTFIALIETYQNEDGSVTIPGALRPYMKGVEKITADK
ncbi:MAG: serine--tRNA ligase [Candidatus Aureabacteria bacterium]|nr:serine--tRNA ligase [Candidatus Auribacterota bacterium]